MARKASPKKNSDAVETSAMALAMSMQRPGQTKEQTKLIARGIEKGIARYKKQHSAKARELDKSLKQLNRRSAEPASDAAPAVEVVRYRQHWLPWALLLLTWAAIAGFVYLR